MKSTGIRRKVDDLGRIVIPAGIRKSLSIREGDAVDVWVDGDRVVLAKPADRCVFCGSDEPPLHAFRDKLVCRPCVASVGVLDGDLRQPATEPGPAAPPTQRERDGDLPSWDLPAKTSRPAPASADRHGGAPRPYTESPLAPRQAAESPKPVEATQASREAPSTAW